MTTAQAQDLGREFQKILQGTSTPADVKGASLIDPLRTQGRVSFSRSETGNEAHITTPSTRDLLEPDLEKLLGRVQNPDQRLIDAAKQEAAQKLSRALNDRNQATGESLSPEFLALRDAAQHVLSQLSGNPNAAAQATSLEGEEARVRNETDRFILDPLRQKLEAGLKGHKYPISLGAIDRVSEYPSSTKELIQAITRRIEPGNLSRSAQENVEDFLKTGETQFLFDMIFKNRGAFEGALGFIRTAHEATPGDQALMRATSLLSQLSDKSLKPDAKWAEDYPYTRKLLKDAIAKLSQDSTRTKDRDAHLLALRLLDEMGLEGVTDRDTKEQNSYLPENLYQELRAEQAFLIDECRGSSDPESCIQKLERGLLDGAAAFVGKPTGLTSEIRRHLLKNTPPKEHLRRYEHLEKGSPLRQGALFSEKFDPSSVKDFQTSEIPPNERSQRLDMRKAGSQDLEALQKALPGMFSDRMEASKESADLAQRLSVIFSGAAADLTEGDPDQIQQIKAFYRCLSTKLAEQAGGYNNPLAIRSLAVWYSAPNAPGGSARLKIAAKQFKCDLPEDLEALFVPPSASSPETDRVIREQTRRLSGLDEKENKLSPSKLSEEALIELENLRRLNLDLQREQTLFGGSSNPVIADLISKREALVRKMKDLGLSQLLEDFEVKKLLAPPQDQPPLTRKEVERLERDYKLVYDPQTNSFVVTPETKIDEAFLKLLSRAQGINLRYLGPGSEEETFLLNGGNARSLLALMAQEASSLGLSPLSTEMKWDDIKKLDAENPDLKPVPKWFPFTSSTSARLIEKDGKLSADFIPTEKLSQEAREKMEAVIKARTDAHTAASDYGQLDHSAKAYFGAMAGFKPEETSEALAVEKAYNRYAELRAAFSAIGITPIAGAQLSTVRFNNTELQMMKDYLHREEESIHEFLTNVDTIHSLTEMAVTAAVPVGNLIALEGKLAQLAAGTGKAAFAARQALRATRLAIQLRNTTRSGLKTATGFEGVSMVADGFATLLPDSANAIVEDRIRRAKEGRMGDDWRKHPENPALDPKWGSLDKKTGQPTDPKLRSEFLQAMLEFNIEDSMDVDGDGVIDELQGPAGTPVPFAKKRTLMASLTNPHRLQGFTDSAAFFRNLGLAKALPVPRLIALPTEMAFAGAVQEAMRSEESLRWEGKQTGQDPGSLPNRIAHSLKGNAIEGARFGLSGSVSNAALTQMVGGRRSAFNTFLGASLFVAVDAATKAAVNQINYGETGLGRGSWEETVKDFIRENAVSFYIGKDIARSGLEKKNLRDLKATYLQGGEPALRKALEEQGKPREVQDQLLQLMLSTTSDHDFRASSRSNQRAHLALLDTRLKESEQRLLAAQKAAFRAGEEIITPDEARRVGQINRELLQLFREGSWNRKQEIAKLLNEQNGIFNRVTGALEASQKSLRAEEARLAQDAASTDPEAQLAFEQKTKKLEAHYEMVTNLQDAATRMAPLRVLAEPVETIAALTDPRSQLAETHFSDSPAALRALKRYQKSVGEKAWETLTNFGGWLAEEHIAPDLRRGDSGQGGPSELVFGERPTGGITGREQRSAAEFVERVFRDKKTSPQEKRELISILLQLDPVKADKLVRGLEKGEKSK
jgi:hypothetical protein